MCQTFYIGGRCRYLHRRDALFMITTFLFQKVYKGRMFLSTQQDDIPRPLYPYMVGTIIPRNVTVSASYPFLFVISSETSPCENGGFCS